MPPSEARPQRVGRRLWLLLWLSIGVAKTAAVVLLLTSADTRWPEALLCLGLAWGGAAVAMRWRARST